MGSDGFSPGDVIADKYRVVRTIGRGGMGVVLAADHLQLDKTVAVKILKGDANQVSLARFSREARAVAQITSPHVCQVFDVGVLPNGDPFMVMELLEGCDLAQLSKQGRVLSGEQVVDYILQACEALAEAHSKGIVHRDLKPGNLFLAKQPNGRSVIKLLDFGISKSLSGPDHGLTQTDAVVGSPRFMAPEQLKSSKDVDNRADIWSLGVLMHELLTGKAAFGAGTIAELFVRILQEDPEPLRELRPDVSPGLDRGIYSCLEKERDDRPANVAELALALAPYGSATAKTSCDTITHVYEATGWKRSEPAADEIVPELMGTVRMDEPQPSAEPAAAPTSDDASTCVRPAAPIVPSAAQAPVAPHVAAPMQPASAQPAVAEPAVASGGAAAAVQSIDGVAASPPASRGTVGLAPKLAAGAAVVVIGAAVLVWKLVDSAPPAEGPSASESGASEQSAEPDETAPSALESTASDSDTAVETAEPATSLAPSASATAPIAARPASPPKSWGSPPTATSQPKAPPPSQPKAPPPSQPEAPKDRIGF